MVKFEEENMNMIYDKIKEVTVSFDIVPRKLPSHIFVYTIGVDVLAQSVEINNIHLFY